MKSVSLKHGITLVELMVAVAIMAILLGIVAIGFSSNKKELSLGTSAEQLATKLEEAKTNALAGKYGMGSGISFGSTTYTLFLGNTFSASSSNEIIAIPEGFSLKVTPNVNEIVFSRLTGRPGSAATVTISSLSSSTTKKDIIIGIEGDIMIK